MIPWALRGGACYDCSRTGPIQCLAHSGWNSVPNLACDPRSGELPDLLGLRLREVVAIVGAGGKTTTMFRLAADLVARGRRVVTSKTTFIAKPTLRQTPHLLVCPSLPEALAQLPGELAHHPHLSLVTGYLREDLLQGLALDWVGPLRDLEEIDHLLIEADGARRRLVKAPGDHEPVLPPEAEVVLAVACLDVLGRPLDEGIAHRPERIAALTGRALGDPIRPKDLARLLTHEAGGRKLVPPDARFYPVLTRLDETNQAVTEEVAALILATGTAHGVILSSRATDPALITYWAVEARQ